MKLRYLAAALLLLSAAPANADAINNLSIQVIPDPDVVPQSKSSPCVICATNVQNPPTFGFNNFNSTGNDSSFNLFSTNLFQALGNDIEGTPYTAGQLGGILNPLNTPNVFLSFAIAIDINTTKANSEYLDLFQLINLDGDPGERIIFDIRNVALPGIHNGNGAADYLLTGFDLSGIDAGDRLIFRAQWHGAVDGGESFYIVPQIVAVPGPAVGAGIPGIIAGCVALWGLARHRRRRQAVA